MVTPWFLLFTDLQPQRAKNPKTKAKVCPCQTKENLDVFLISLPSPPRLYSPLSLSFLPSLFSVHRNALLRAEIKGTKDAIDKNDSVPIRLCVDVCDYVRVGLQLHAFVALSACMWNFSFKECKKEARKKVSSCCERCEK